MAIEYLPIETKQAMLDGIRNNEIIVGAYTNRSGGVCPMLAAHRHGGRTSFSSFARAWDRYTKADNRARKATDHEVLTLVAMLEASIATDAPVSNRELTQAVEEHKALKRRSDREDADPAGAITVRQRQDTGERNRAPELRRKHGWAWSRLFRRVEDYEAAVEAIQDEAAEQRDFGLRP